MPRMSKKRKHELSFYLNDRGRVTYNELCRKCQHGCITSALLCENHNYLSYYNKSLRCFQEKAQQLLAMQKNTAIFQCEA